MNANTFRKRKFTYLALKFSKIEYFHIRRLLFGHFAFYPMLQALKMHKLTRSFTFTRRNQQVIRLWLRTQAYSTRYLHIFLTISLQMRLFFLYIGINDISFLFLFFTAEMANLELNIAKLDMIANFLYININGTQLIAWILAASVFS